MSALPDLVRAACDAAETALPIFEGILPDDVRPRAALDAGRAWASGTATMTAARRAAFAAHAAARDAKTQGSAAAEFAARAAGHAAATAHVAAHAPHAAAYARRACAHVPRGTTV